MKSLAYREIFSSLPHSDRIRLQSYAGITALMGLINFHLNYNGPAFLLGLSIVFSLLFIYWSIFWKRAPSFYFWLIPVSFWIVLIFDGLNVISIAFDSQIFWELKVTSFINLIVIAIFAKTIFKYRQILKKETPSNTGLGN
jgi:hypothetical protein